MIGFVIRRPFFHYEDYLLYKESNRTNKKSEATKYYSCLDENEETLLNLEFTNE